MNTYLYRQAITRGETEAFYFGVGTYRNEAYFGYHNRIVNYECVFEYGREEGYDVMFEQITKDFTRILETQSVDSYNYYLLIDLLYTYLRRMNSSCCDPRNEMPEWHFDDRLIHLFVSNYDRLKQTDDMSYLIVENDRIKSIRGIEVLPIGYKDLLSSKNMVANFQSAIRANDGAALFLAIERFASMKSEDYSDNPLKEHEYPSWKTVLVYFMYEMVAEGLVCNDDINATFFNMKFNDNNILCILDFLIDYVDFYEASEEHHVLKIKISSIKSRISDMITSKHFLNSADVWQRFCCLISVG
ncbi:MAG: hypothetical protein IJT89_12110 [Bacteroidaceae bacterium]|nr:hypothetical protein [Bacteroidaceae bacterium]